MNQCVFCQIVCKELPASVIYEDDKVISIMDIHPINEGACMVLPKMHIDHFTDLSDELASRIIVIAQKISRNIMKELHPQRVGYVVHGYGVAHAHFVIVPQLDADDITSRKIAKVENGAVAFDHKLIPTAERSDLDKLAKLLSISV